MKRFGKKIEIRMGRKAVIITAIAAVLVVLAVGIGIWRFAGSGGGDGSVVYVNSVESIMNPGSAGGAVNRFAGVVETQKEMKIQTSADKTVKEIYVSEGDEVSVGTKLFSYDITQDEDNLAKAKLELERIDNSLANKREEIAELERERKNASSDMQLDYTIQIQSAQMELKQTEYEKQSKTIEVGKLQNSIENADVLSEMPGIVKSINDGTSGEMDPYGDGDTAFMTIISMGNYRVKGKVNEQNMGSVMAGQPVIVHSRVDESKTWKGVMGQVDLENPGNDSNGMYYYGGDSMTQSNSYPFYVDLDSSEGLMLGQHVYIEPDYGQAEEKKGILLEEYYICDVDSDPYVWADNGHGKLEKRSVTLGSYDEELFRYEILDGLALTDLITYPEEMLKEGMSTADGLGMQSGFSGEMDDMEGGMELEDGASMDGMEIEGGADVDGMEIEGGADMDGMELEDGADAEDGMELEDGADTEGGMETEGGADAESGAQAGITAEPRVRIHTGEGGETEDAQ